MLSLRALGVTASKSNVRPKYGHWIKKKNHQFDKLTKFHWFTCAVFSENHAIND